MTANRESPWHAGPESDPLLVYSCSRTNNGQPLISPSMMIPSPREKAIRQFQARGGVKTCGVEGDRVAALLQSGEWDWVGR